MVTFADPSTGQDDDGLYYLADAEGGDTSSIPTSDLPLTTTDNPGPLTPEAVLLAAGFDPRKFRTPSPRRGVQPPPIPGSALGTVPTRPGWNTGNKQVIWFGCYQHGHILLECNFPISRFDKVVENYEKLSADDKARVPRTHYEMAKRFIDAKRDQEDKQPDADKTNDNADKETSKN